MYHFNLKIRKFENSKKRFHLSEYHYLQIVNLKIIKLIKL